ncbi:MAG: hypothetical protein O2909_03130 [Chloroflexi bacterium]|nr:hypothetical protein [Chloroflexota bacterium]MDA1218417.1 hypothetical protein [Chloroflexota bacterium]PKB57422.1 MAG: hypothetical protein BZY73_03215 [SAR202 cluster bacterium Casp-Chloro-G3]
MMQTFRVTDALRCLVLNTPKSPNLACPRSSPTKHATLQNLDLWKKALTQQDNRITLATWNGIRLGGLVSARTCSGRVWEIDHLYLPASQPNNSLSSNNPRSSDGLSYEEETASLELLEQLTQEAGLRNAERIFLRLPSGLPVITLARRTGFFPYFEETLMEGWAGIVPDHREHLAESIRVRQQQDEYSLFQLFCACTPATVRVALGLTCDQWQEALSLRSGKRLEWIDERDGKIVGWLAQSNWRGTVAGQIMAHPDHPELLNQLMTLSLSNPSYQRWLVPDYQQPVRDQLNYRGLREAARYTMLVNTVAAPVRCAGMAPVEA